MNKTVNINLANVLFHIDEEAYNKMRRYLEAIKRSFANTAGSDEILADIEARIAELFHEKLENERQVITNKEVDEVITIMGQPEDYMVDEDIFEDEPAPKKEKKKVKKLYRDTELKYVAGVSSGLAHYVGIDPLWIRLLWVFFTIGSGGGFILIYGLLWILIPEASSTSQKLDMRGEAVNISNIERKVKEGFDEVAEKVKSVDYEKVGNQVKSSGKTFFDVIGEIIMFFFKIFGKFIGIILIIIGASTILGLFIGFIAVGTLDWVHLPGFNNFITNSSQAPVWLLSLLVFFAIGIPFFFLLYLGLKILVKNLKSIGNIAKFSLLGLWIISIISLIIIGVREAAAHAYSGNVTTEHELYIDTPRDTVFISSVSSKLHENRGNIHMDGLIMSYDDNGEEVILSEDVRINIKRSKDSIIRLEVRKEANGASFNAARETADQINYSYKVEGNTIILDNFLTLKGTNKFNDLEVKATLYLPENTILNYSKSNNRCWSTHTNNDHDMNGCELTKYSWKIAKDNQLVCLDCPKEKEREEENKVIINENGIKINVNENGENNKILINEDGIDIDVKDNGETFKMKIDENGIDINTNEDN
ncbi:phage shock protein C (PspC) family protein [Maribacter vaceletii]|uniref:Phage shock protein C (PspC) family protein n=1 Tax=Maribacter vaceletii TaxID=1206816 RepID=A0A495DUR2_9FLAO|nr:PspC domain-containing protein [Maribacter vaceletii]RKR07919.1 phage shock protein C (PspC) family protein [Maribacter vaceletii]